MLFFDPINQDQSYHNFADDRAFLGIPNFSDVVTNIFFLLLGFMGFLFCLRNRQKIAPWSWILFFFGVTIVSFGSAYYHWTPNNATVVWDRLPITIGFMSLFIAILSEYVRPQLEKIFLIPAILAGVLSVIYWYHFDDLRFYGWIQFIPLIIIPIVMLLFKGKHSHQRYLIYAIIFYIMAKVTEIYDKDIFKFNDELLSGHTLKHLLASLGLLILYFMIKKRKRI
jgi:hypothetical protein